jgi:hypothetical protein
MNLTRLVPDYQINDEQIARFLLLVGSVQAARMTESDGIDYHV